MRFLQRRNNADSLSMSALTVGETLILTVWAVSAFALNHAVKRPVKTAGRQRIEREIEKRDIQYLSSKEDKENIVETVAQFIWQTPEQL